MFEHGSTRNVTYTLAASSLLASSLATTTTQLVPVWLNAIHHAVKSFLVSDVTWADQDKIWTSCIILGKEREGAKARWIVWRREADHVRKYGFSPSFRADRVVCRDPQSLARVIGAKELEPADGPCRKSSQEVAAETHGRRANKGDQWHITSDRSSWVDIEHLRAAVS